MLGMSTRRISRSYERRKVRRKAGSSDPINLYRSNPGFDYAAGVYSLISRRGSPCFWMSEVVGDRNSDRHVNTGSSEAGRDLSCRMPRTPSRKFPAVGDRVVDPVSV